MYLLLQKFSDLVRKNGIKDMTLLSMREVQITEGIEIDGVLVRRIKKLIIPIDEVDSIKMERFKDMVDEVVDSASAPTQLVVEV